ncbi:MAG: phage tail protein [Chitinophagales bacterium]
MSDPYLGEIRMFAGNYAPLDWALCNGQLLNISQYSALFSLIGTYYGGDGTTTFALPDLRGRVPVGQGQGPGLTNRTMGQMDGAETVTLTVSNLPTHSHAVMVNNSAGTLSSPSDAVWASNVSQYSTASPDGQMSSAAITSSGSSTAHENMMPSFCINFVICLNGIFPSQG